MSRLSVERIPDALGLALAFAFCFTPFLVGLNQYFSPMGCSAFSCPLLDVFRFLDNDRALARWGVEIGSVLHLMKAALFIYIIAGGVAASAVFLVLKTKRLIEIDRTNERWTREVLSLVFAVVLFVPVISLISPDMSLRGSQSTPGNPNEMFMMYALLGSVSIYAAPVSAWEYMRRRFKQRQQEAHQLNKN